MQSKILGRTGLEVPIVSFGTAFLARVMGADGHFLPGVDEDVGVENVVAAIEAGCTLVDTAPLYGNTVSEKIIGRALRERPDLAAMCTVTTKVGRSGNEYDFSSDGVMQQVEDSQERLGLDAFDVLYIHDPMDFPMQQVMAKDGALGALRKLQDE
ncbi:MAG: aldo/keto reductase, partial [Candidatus Poribacteria bacterium]|nr:aldo/keto reductase [Candidatus Poribacteria bacterium]